MPIALAKNMSVSEILDFNLGINPDLLMVGQAIQLPSGRITDPSVRITHPKDGTTPKVNVTIGEGTV